MFKIVKEEAPNYLINLIPKIQQTTRRRINHMLTIHCRTDCFKNCFFPSTPNDWYKLHETIRNSESISIFKSRLLSFIRPLESNVYNIFDPIGLKFLTRLRLGFSHLNESSASILCVFVVWKLKIHRITFCTAITFLIISLIL